MNVEGVVAALRGYGACSGVDVNYAAYPSGLGEGQELRANIPVNPRLAAISGPLRDSVFPLQDGSLTIGREISNQLILNDTMVSPQLPGFAELGVLPQPLEETVRLIVQKG